jgi:hypothetical protein
MNTDWIAYLITALAAITLVVIFIRKKKQGGCCKNPCSGSNPPDDKS